MRENGGTDKLLGQRSHSDLQLHHQRLPSPGEWLSLFHRIQCRDRLLEGKKCIPEQAVAVADGLFKHGHHVGLWLQHRHLPVLFRPQAPQQGLLQPERSMLGVLHKADVPDWQEQQVPRMLPHARHCTGRSASLSPTVLSWPQPAQPLPQALQLGLMSPHGRMMSPPRLVMALCEGAARRPLLQLYACRQATAQYKNHCTSQSRMET